MRIDLNTIRSTGYAGQSPSLLSDWRVGAILQAVALRDARSGELWLKIGDARYAARIASGNAAGPADGEQLTVRVLRSSPVLALETLSTQQASGGDDVAADALRRFLPRQSSAAPLLSNLGWVANGKGAEALPPTVTQAANRLWQALPDAAALSDPDGLKTAVVRSGAFLESTLANGDRRTMAASVAQDVKALLLNFSRVLRDLGARPAAATAESTVHSPLPLASGPLTSLPAAPATLAVVDLPAQQMNELARQTDGALARMTALQAGASTQDPALQSMLVEIPVRHGDRANILRLRIEHDRSRQRDGGAGESWAIEAAMDLGHAGALHARVTLHGQRIGVQLRADSAGVVDTLISRAPELESMLREAGLEVDRVVCLHGLPAGDHGARPTRLLDLRA
ncbi:flagellar hook-length control protein FliK [Povalibacter sp.]|uniref:flagellar hook-length control protein FliK n=1 Tax=Povalibacter sp. TaxID=1962978 RepID=UPI002F417B21